MSLTVSFSGRRPHCTGSPSVSPCSRAQPVLIVGFPLISAALLKPCLLFLRSRSRYFVAGGFSDSPPWLLPPMLVPVMLHFWAQKKVLTMIIYFMISLDVRNTFWSSPGALTKPTAVLLCSSENTSSVYLAIIIIFSSSPKDVFLLILQREGGGERETSSMWDRNIDWSPSVRAPKGDRSAT